MADNNTITLSGAFFNAEHNNGITTTAVFAQSASNRGLITHQGTFVDSTSNRGLASGVVVFQGSAANDGTVAEAVFLDASRNVGTVTASATFANTSVNAGVVQGAAVLIDQASNTGVLASSVQIGASASNTGTVFGTITPHTQGNGYFVYGYYAGGVRTAPPNYATVAHQVGDIWYTYDASGVASLANGEYDDGTTTLYVFVHGIKSAQSGGGGGYHPYEHLGYYSDDAVLINGVSILYVASGAEAAVAADASGGGVDLDADGNHDDWTTDVSGVVSWSMHVAYAYAHLGYYSSDEVLIYSSSVLYDAQGTGAAVVSNASGGGVDLDADGNDDDWTTDASGIIYWSMHIQYAYSHLGYFSSDAVLVNGSSVLYAAQGTGAGAVLNTNGSADVDGDGNDDDWMTDGAGTISWSMHVLYPYAHGSYYSLDIILESGVSVLYDGQGTGASVAANITPFYIVFGVGYIVSTDGEGVVTLTGVFDIQINGTYYYYTGVIENGNVLYLEPPLTNLAVNIPAYVINISGSDYTISTNANGEISLTTATITLDGTVYYYAGTVSNGNTLYTNSGLSVPAANLVDLYALVAGTGYLLSTDGSGIISLDAILAVNLNGTPYYYTGAIENGNILYSDLSLTTPAAGLTNLPINVSGTDYALSTNESGSISLVVLMNVTLDGTVYYYTGTLDNGTILYSDTLTTPAANLTDLPINLGGTDYLLSTDGSGVVTLAAV